MKLSWVSIVLRIGVTNFQVSSSNLKVSRGIYEVAAQKTGSKFNPFKQPHSVTGQMAIFFVSMSCNPE